LLFAPLVVLGLDLAVAEWRRRASPDYHVVALSGLLFGLSVMIKQTAAFEALLAAGLVCTKPRVQGVERFHWRALLLFVLFGTLPSLGFLGYFALEGVEPSLYMAPFIGASHRLSGDGISFLGGVWRFLPMLKPILPLFLGMLLLATEWRSLDRSGDAIGIRVLGLWALASAAGVVAMRSMYFQYFFPLVPPFLLGSLVVIQTYLSRIEVWRSHTATAAVLGATLAAYPLVWLSSYERDDAAWTTLPTKIAENLRSAGMKPDDGLYVPDQETTIYLLAGAQIPTRFPQSQHLICDFSLPSIDQADEIRRIMASKPRFVVVAHDRPWMVCERPDRMAIVDAALAESYTHQATVTDRNTAVDIYCRSGTCLGSKATRTP
jgi:hypothetical protein